MRNTVGAHWSGTVTVRKGHVDTRAGSDATTAMHTIARAGRYNINLHRCMQRSLPRELPLTYVLQCSREYSLSPLLNFMVILLLVLRSDLSAS